MKTKSFSENKSLHRFARLSLWAIAAVFLGAGAATAQTQRSIPEPIDGAEVAPPSISSAIPQCPSQEILAGVDDMFSTANGPELTAPSATLQNRSGPPYAQFDDTGINKRFIHTFRLPPCKCLVGAKLEFRAKALGSCSLHSSGNDTVALGFSTVPGASFWSAYFGKGNPADRPTLDPANCWGAPLMKVFTLDLAALPIVPPPSGGGTLSLLSAMQTNGYLDFAVQDDTSIDYIKLRTTMCDCCKPTGRAEICISKFYDKNRNGMKDPNDTGLAGWTFQANDPGGGNLVVSPPTNAAGRICFAVLAPATYVISEVQKPGWIQTAPTPANPVVTVTPGGVLDLAFGNWRQGVPGDEPDTSNPTH